MAASGPSVVASDVVGTLSGGAGSNMVGVGGTRGSGTLRDGAAAVAFSGGLLLRKMEGSGTGTGLGVLLGTLGAAGGLARLGTIGAPVGLARLGTLGAPGGLAKLVSKVVSCCSASTWLSVSGASGELADGFCSAATMSWRPARIKSVEEARGIGILEGNHEMVSQMRVVLVSKIHTLKQR